jgi:uncharacterized protein YqeY
MALKEQLAADLKTSMRGGEEQRKQTIRLAMASIHNAEIAAGHELDDAGVAEVVRREVKQRRDSIDEYRRAGRDDLADRENAELEILRTYLPQQLSRDEIATAAREVIAEVGATGPRDKGKVMGPLLNRLAGQAEGRDVNEVVTALLGG